MSDTLVYAKSYCKADPLENCHLNVKKLPKIWHFSIWKMPKMFIFSKMAIFWEKNDNFCLFFLKSSFWQFFDIQMTIFQRVSFRAKSVIPAARFGRPTSGGYSFSFTWALTFFSSSTYSNIASSFSILPSLSHASLDNHNIVGWKEKSYKLLVLSALTIKVTKEEDHIWEII